MSNSTDSASSTTTTDSSTSDAIGSTTITSTDTPTTSTSIVTETSTVTSGSTTFVTTSESTSVATITSSISAETSTTTVAPPTTSTSPSSVVQVTSYLTITSDGGDGPSVVTLTSTVPLYTSTRPQSSSASSSQPSALTASGADGSSSSSTGLSSGGKIAIAVVIPLVAIALAFVFGLFFYKKRQKRKSEEAMRQKEMADYGYNPNNDPNLVPAGAVYADNGSESAEENSGYRGWGNTSTTQRKPSTTMGSGSRGPVGMAMSESSSNQGGYGHPGSDHYSGDTVTGAAAAAGAAGMVRRRSNNDINRGPSNASSAYSAGHGALSEMSDDVAGPTAVPGPYYHEEVPYNIYNEQQAQGPYGDGRPAGPPVIQNVGARRDTRIERVPTFPQQQAGNPGIAHNF